MVQDVRRLLQTKNSAPKARAPLNSIKVGSPLQLVAVDILGPLPELQLEIAMFWLSGIIFQGG